VRVEFVRDKGKAMPQVERPEDVHSLKIWHCGFKSLLGLEVFCSLKKLVIAGFPDYSLEVVAHMPALEELEIVHLPNVKSLLPLARLGSLRTLSLGTLPSWDASGKRSWVESLAPLAHLQRLESLELLGLLPLDKSLTPIRSCRGLRQIRMVGYPAGEVRQLRASLPSITVP
jgi:hypothetical protein